MSQTDLINDRTRKDKKNARSRKEREELKDWYIRALLKKDKNFPFPNELITTELIETKKEQILLYRSLRELKNTITEIKGNK